MSHEVDIEVRELHRRINNLAARVDAQATLVASLAAAVKELSEAIGLLLAELTDEEETEP